MDRSSALRIGSSLLWLGFCACGGDEGSPSYQGDVAGTTSQSPSGGASGSTQGQSGAPAAGGSAATSEKFSFFVTSWKALQRLSGSADGFGGDLRYGEADGLSGADKICAEIAESSLTGSGAKGWRAFLSVTKGVDGQPVNAIDRVGQGPWYDRTGRLVAQNLSDLGQERPKGADSAIINDLPNEDGVPNHAPDGKQVDNHDMLTGSNTTGKLYNTDWKYTCHDWTSSVGKDGTPRVGHSWPRGGGGSGRAGVGDMSGANWMSALTEAGCAAGANLIEMGGPNPSVPTVGSGGGYGGFYCFALKP